ncbi:MAG: hypothetical protein PHD56_09185 [Anaerostipes sp.]|nr:hypothetical protein [Anaerostipes sp.]
MKKIFKLIMIIFFLAYILQAFYISSKIYQAAKDSYKGENNKYEYISNKDYKELSWRDTDKAVTNDDIRRLFPITVHWFVGAKTYYFCYYNSYSENKKILSGGNFQYNIKSSLVRGKWRVLEVENQMEENNFITHYIGEYLKF